jgi:AraC-like DNA-binding protein
MEAPESKKPGRRAYVPTDESRAIVRRMAGARHADIAAVVGISVPTLRKVFRAELAAGKAADLFTGDAPPPARAAPRKPVGGRKPFEPKAWDKRRVMELAATGKPASAIARVVGITEPTLRKHFATELATGAEMVEAELTTALMTKARAGSVAAIREARAILAQARLDGMESALRGQSMPSAKPDTPGKKLQATLDAASVIENAAWAAHLRPN